MVAHLHFGHIGKERLLQLVERLDDIMIKPGSKLSQCDVCLLTKMTHKAIMKGPAPQEKEKGAMFHADISSMPAESIGGKIAFVSFIDDATCYPICHKSEASVKFEELLKRLPDNIRARRFRSDGGGEFAGGPFQEVLKDHGIAFEPSPPYTPEFNGVAEHFNRDIVSMVRAMLAGANMCTGFWEEALQYAVCILNATPTKSNNGICNLVYVISPIELWDGKPPRLAHLRPFGAHAYLHIPEEQCNTAECC